MIKAYVGAGGKTSLIMEEAERLRNKGEKVFVTTSTHMFIEEDTITCDDPEVIIEELNRKGYVMAGVKDGAKIKALSKDTYNKVCQAADQVLIEGDGSKHLPLKYPNDSEPVIYENVDEIVVVCGMHGLGKTVEDAVFRWELAEEFLDINKNQIVDHNIIQKLVMKGYVEPLMEKYKDKKISISPQKEKSLYERVICAMLKDQQDVSLIKKSWFEPKPKLIVCGGGHVAYELINMAAFLDFRIKVIDDRREFANEERFGKVAEVICDSFDNLEKYLEDNAFYVVVTRGHKDDYECLKKIIDTPYRYLGMIGSKLKVKTTFDNLREEGVDEEVINSIFAPIGLPIKAETPAEIAVSILAQIVQEKNMTNGAVISSQLLNSTQKGVLCIIIDKKGSAPRGEGSMMLVTEENVIDTIGGGAVEFSAISDAKKCKKVMIKEYHLDNEKSRELGMICGGSNRVLFVPVEEVK